MSATQAVEDKVDKITVDNKTGASIGVTIKYKGPDGTIMLAGAFLAPNGTTYVAGITGKIEFVDLTLPSRDTTIKKQDNGTRTRDGMTERMWALTKGDPRLDVPPDTCAYSPTFPTDVEGEPIDSIPGDGCSLCDGCPDAEHAIVTPWTIES